MPHRGRLHGFIFYFVSNVHGGSAAPFRDVVVPKPTQDTFRCGFHAPPFEPLLVPNWREGRLTIFHFTAPQLPLHLTRYIDRFIMMSNDDTNTNNPGAVPPCRPPTQEEMHAVFTMCRQNRWNSVLHCIRGNHLIPVTSMIMDNHISTTILHQAITSKGDTKARTRVMQEILDIAPKAAAIKNGYGSLPLHVISQRNTKLDAPTKELLIFELVNAYKGALIEEGGVGKRTPLHIIYTGTSFLFVGLSVVVLGVLTNTDLSS